MVGPDHRFALLPGQAQEVFQKISFHRQLPDLGVQLPDRPASGGSACSGRAQRRPLPLRPAPSSIDGSSSDGRRIGSPVRHRVLAFHGLQRHTSLEARACDFRFVIADLLWWRPADPFPSFRHCPIFGEYLQITTRPTELQQGSNEPFVFLAVQTTSRGAKGLIHKQLDPLSVLRRGASLYPGNSFDISVVASRMNARKNLEGIYPATDCMNSMFSGAPEHWDVGASSTAFGRCAAGVAFMSDDGGFAVA